MVQTHRLNGQLTHMHTRGERGVTVRISNVFFFIYKNIFLFSFFFFFFLSPNEITRWWQSLWPSDENIATSPYLHCYELDVKLLLIKTQTCPTAAALRRKAFNTTSKHVWPSLWCNHRMQSVSLLALHLLLFCIKNASCEQDSSRFFWGVFWRRFGVKYCRE